MGYWGQGQLEYLPRVVVVVPDEKIINKDDSQTAALLQQLASSLQSRPRLPSTTGPAHERAFELAFPRRVVHTRGRWV